MKRTKLILSLIVVVVLVAVLACTFTSCLKIGMQEKSVYNRLKQSGATVSYPNSAAPITGWQSQNISIGTIILAVMNGEGQNSGDENESSEEGSSAEIDVVSGSKTLYVFYANDKKSADWIESRCKAYKSENAELCQKWNIYRYEDIVMFGHFELLSIARQY